MAAYGGFFCLIFASTASGSTILEHILSDVDPCEDACQKTYPSHTYEKSTVACCLRGCRLYSIIELVGEEGGTNGTLKSCVENCQEAYPRDGDGAAACTLGCRSQKPVADKWGPMPSLQGVGGVMGGVEGGLASLLSPMLYMHSMYSNMVDKVSQHASVSWSFYMQDGTGRLVVVKSQPQTLELSQGGDFDELTVPLSLASGRAPGVAMVAGHDAATQPLHDNQVMAARTGDHGDISFSADDSAEPSAADSSDWLSCIANRTGLPRLLLCAVILLTALAMVWLCMSAAVTAPDHRLAQHKLSIHGDLDYLRLMVHKKGVHPQDFVEARPLPMKIRIADL